MEQNPESRHRLVVPGSVGSAADLEQSLFSRSTDREAFIRAVKHATETLTG